MAPPLSLKVAPHLTITAIETFCFTYCEGLPEPSRSGPVPAGGGLDWPGRWAGTGERRGGLESEWDSSTTSHDRSSLASHDRFLLKRDDHLTPVLEGSRVGGGAGAALTGRVERAVLVDFPPPSGLRSRVGNPATGTTLR